MEKLLLTLVTLVLVSSCSGQSPSCTNYPCPEYEVVEKNKDFEVRRYVDTDWITTKLNGRDSFAFMAASRTLRAFCNQQKAAGNVILDGWPVLITSTEGQTPSTTLSWFLAPDSNPEVTSTSVTVEHKPATNIYVRSYGGFPSRASAENNIKILREALTKAGKKFISDIYMGAHYNAFFSFTHQNEVWMYSA